MSLSTWFKSEISNFLGWFGVEESKVVTFAKPIIQKLGSTIKDDVWADIETGIPVVATALAGGIPAALTAAEGVLVPKLIAQGIQLEQTAVNFLSNALVSQAQAQVSVATALVVSPTVSVPDAPPVV